MLRPGELIAGKYRIERLLGAGGMGSVYVAVNVVLEKRVALKVMGEAFAQQPEAVQRFFREAMSASRVRHPAIIQIYDAGAHEGAPWMAMELLDGESLAQRIERAGPLHPSELAPIVEPVLAALDAVHAHGIVHRDLKPDNIFLELLPDGRIAPKVLDFGIAKTHDALTKLTATGAVMGTAHYLAPEQARDSSSADLRTDLYSFGVILYESLSGRLPHEANTLPELITKLVTVDPTPLLTFAPHVPVALANCVHWCLAREPASRPQRATELLHYLRPALAELRAEPFHAPAYASPAPPRLATGSADPRVGAAFVATGIAGPPAGALGPAHAGGTMPLTAGWTPPVQAPVAYAPEATAPLASAPAAYTPAAYAPAAYAPSSPRAAPAPKRSGATFLVVAVIGLALLAGGCVLIAPIGVAIAVRLLGSGSGSGSGTPAFAGLTRTWPRWWESWRVPFFVDVDADRDIDVVGWSRQLIDSDLHELLCAFDGTDGSELWCADLGEQDHLSDTRTVLLGRHVVYFDHRGAASAIVLRTGARLDWQASVQGTVSELCTLGADRIAARTSDQLWSVLTVASGAVSAPSATAPSDCAPAATTEPRHTGGKIHSRTWTEAHDRRPRQTGLQIRQTYRSPSSDDVLAIGVGAEDGRQVGKLALLRGGVIEWEAIVAADPIAARPQVPNAVSILETVVIAVYGLTARGDAPQHAAAFRIADGQRLWDVPLPDAHGYLGYVVADGDLALVAVNETLIALDVATGAIRYRIGERSQH